MGNRLGWVIAGIFVVFVIVLGVLLIFPSPSMPRETARAGMLDFQKPAVPISTVIGREPSDGGDAGDDYVRAIQVSKAKDSAIKEILYQYDGVRLGKRGPLTAQELTVLNEVNDILLAGVSKKQMTYYFRRTPKTIEIPYYATLADDFQDMMNVPKMLFENYMAAGESTYPQAEKAMFEILVIGWQLMNERSRMEITRKGVGLQKYACEELRDKLYRKWNQPQRLAAVNSYYDGLVPMSSIYTELFNDIIWRLSTQSDGSWGPYPGDIFNLVENHEDQSVRAEATLVLGVLKMTCSARGDKRKCRSLIDAQLGSKNPIERVAAECAEKLTPEGLANLGRGETK